MYMTYLSTTAGSAEEFLVGGYNSACSFPTTMDLTVAPVGALVEVNDETDSVLLLPTIIEDRSYCSRT